MSLPMGNTTPGLVTGWALTAWLAIAVMTGCAAAATLSPDATEAARMVIRLTARTSLVLFVAAFLAASLARLWPSAPTRWLRANRRHVGLAFAFSHAVHAAAIYALSRINPAVFDALTAPAAFIAGGTGYLVIVLMAATSFDRTAALLGPKAWRVLHGAGVWFIALSFLVNFGRRALLMPALYWPYMALIILAIGLRIIAYRRHLAVDR